MRCIALNSYFLSLFICLTTFFFFVLIRCILFEVEFLMNQLHLNAWETKMFVFLVISMTVTCGGSRSGLALTSKLALPPASPCSGGWGFGGTDDVSSGGGDRLSSVCDVLNPELTVSCIICGEKATWACSLSSRIFNIWITWMSTDSWTSTACVKKTDRRLVHYLRLFSPSLPRLLSQNMLNSEEPRPWVPLPDVIPLDWPCALRKHTWCFLCCRFLAFI